MSWFEKAPAPAPTQCRCVSDDDAEMLEIVDWTPNKEKKNNVINKKTKNTADKDIYNKKNLRRQTKR